MSSIRRISGYIDTLAPAVLAYRHPGVVARYVKEFGGDRYAAEELFCLQHPTAALANARFAVPDDASDELPLRHGNLLSLG
jgi:hypothetical protein